jgi:hypothetical protein
MKALSSTIKTVLAIGADPCFRDSRITRRCMCLDAIVLSLVHVNSGIFGKTVTVRYQRNCITVSGRESWLRLTLGKFGRRFAQRFVQNPNSICANLYPFFSSQKCHFAQKGDAVARYDLELHTELIRLLEKQTDLAELATFVRLTEEDVSEYAKRQERISELLAELSALKGVA